MDWIETFLDVLETQNFNITAENFGITQSTVSHRIGKLEQSLGVTLFTRGRRGAIPTWSGLRFESTARNLRTEWRRGKDELRHGSEEQRHIRVGIQYDLARGYAGPILEVIRKQNPQHTIYVEVDYSQQMNRDIERGELDFAFIYTPSQQPNLHTSFLGMLSYEMIAPTPMQLSEVSAADYTYPNISPVFSSAHQALHPTLSNAILQCGQSDAIVQFMRHLGGASYVIKELADRLCKDGGFFGVKDASRIEQPLYLACHIRKRPKFGSDGFLGAFKSVIW